MDEGAPSLVEEKELILIPSPKIVDEDQCLTWEQTFTNNDATKNLKKRRLVITTTFEEPILIEIRPNVVESIAHPLVCTSTQCNVIGNGCYIKNSYLEHINLWNNLYQVIHDANIANCCEEDWLENQGDVEDSPMSIEKKIYCNKLWPKICNEALDKIMFLKQEIHRVEEEKEKEKERCDVLLISKQNDMEKQIELEKDIQNQNCENLEVVIQELKNQVTSQAEEIRRLWIENIANENDELIAKPSDMTYEEDGQETKQRIIELEHQLTNALKQYKIVSKDQEIQCEFLQLNANKYSKNQDVTTSECTHSEHLQLKIEELEKEKFQWQEKITSSSIINEDFNNQIIDYETLVEERDDLKKKLEKVNNDFNRTASKLRDNVAKRRRLEAESEGEKEQRSNLAAALYELESEVEVTISTINSLQFSIFESMTTLANDLRNFEEALKKHAISNNFGSESIIEIDDEMPQSLDSVIKQDCIQNIQVATSNIYKGIPESKSFISKLTKGHEILLAQISRVRKAIQRSLKSHNLQIPMKEKEMLSKLENIESEKETLHQKIIVLEEENKILKNDNLRLQKEVASLKQTKSALNLQLKDLEKEMENFQESLKNLREENRKLLKEARWKSVGKQGGCQESLVVQEWEKKLQKLEADYELLRHAKKDLVKEKHRLEDELDRITEKGNKGLGGSEDRNLEEELSNMTLERNKLRKIKITLAIENVSLKESLAESKIQLDSFENECMVLAKWKETAQKLEEECEDLRDWKKKAESLESECKGLLKNQMQVEAHECQIKNSKTKELGEKHEHLYKNIETFNKECQGMTCDEDCYEEECKRLHECKDNLEKKCERLCLRINCLENDRNILFKLKEKFDKYIESHELQDVDKLKIDVLECGFENLSENGGKVEEQNNLLHQLSSSNIEFCKVNEYLETIANLEQENKKLCQNHQAALDKQWDVLQGDLKAFEAKIEELENECESVRRDHLSSMVENTELVREKERLLTLYNDQKYNYEILETSNECLQKDQVQKEVERMKERNEYNSTIDNLNCQIVELESSFSKKLRQQASSFELCLPPKMKTNGQETITLSRQEYDILLAEKAVMLQERDSAHKKLCSTEVQNLQLSASIERLKKEVPHSNQVSKENGNDAEVLLAQDVVNLRSMLNSLEEELRAATCEKNKMLEINKSIRGELNQVKEALSRCQHENQSLSIKLDELKRRSSLEQIHSAASSLKEQLGKASKEKDLVKEQLARTINEKEQLANVANERDKLINSLKEKIATLEKAKESSINTKLEGVSENVTKVTNQSMITSKESSNIEDVIILKHELESLSNKVLLVNNDLIKKTKLWQNERSNFEEKCRRLEVELMNTREAQTMIKKKLEGDLQEAIQEKHDLEFETKNKVKCIYVQVSQLQDDLSKAKKYFEKKIELATKEMEYITIEINLFLQKIIEFRDRKGLVQDDEEKISHNVIKYNGITKHSILPNGTIEDMNKSNIFISKIFLEQGVQVTLQENLKLETKEINYLEKKTTFTTSNQIDELKVVSKGNDVLPLVVSHLKMEESQLKDAYSCNHNLIQVPKCEDKLECCFALKENHNIQICEKKIKSCIEENIVNQNLCDFKTKVKYMNEQLSNLLEEKDQLTFTKQALLQERDTLLIAIAKVEAEKEAMSKKLEQDLNKDMSSLKDLLTTMSQEKEHLIISQESLHKRFNEYSIIVQSLNEQLENLSYEKNRLAHANEAITLERDTLMEKNSTLAKQLQMIAKIENKSIQEDISNTPLSTSEKKLLLKDHKNLIAKIGLLNKKKEDTGNDFDNIIEHNCSSLNSYRNSFDEALSDLPMDNEQYGNLTIENAQLKEENVTLVQTKKQFTHECKNLLLQISLVKSDSEELKKILRTEMVELTSLLNKCKQYDQMQNECSSLLQSKNNVSEENEIAFKKSLALTNEKESLDSNCTPNLLEEGQTNASIVTLKEEVFSLNKRIFVQKEHIIKLVEENEKLHTELKASKLNNAIISISEEQQTFMPDTIESEIHCNIESILKFEEEFIKINSHLGENILDIDSKSLNKKFQFFKEERYGLIKERDNLKILSKKSEQAHIEPTSVEIQMLKLKSNALDKMYNQLIQENDSAVKENKFLNQQYKTILDETSSTLSNKTNNNNSLRESKVAKSMIIKEEFMVHEIKSLQSSVKSLKEQEEKQEKEYTKIALENEALMNEKSSLIESIALLKKQQENFFTQETNLQHMFEELIESVNTLNKSQSLAVGNEFMKRMAESLTKECDTLLTTFTSKKDMKPINYSKVEHQLHREVFQSMVESKKDSSELENFSKGKFEEFVKKIIVLMKTLIASSKEREKSILELNSLKRESQKLHTTLIASERDKDNLMKSALESRSTIVRIGGEMNQLQRELVEAQLKLTHLAIERDNANLQIVDLQRLLNNHNRMQQLQGPYSLKKIETLEAQNICLKMEKGVIEEQLKKCSLDLEGNYQFQQALPSMPNFKIQKIDSNSLSHTSLHNSTQLFHSGGDSIGRH